MPRYLIVRFSSIGDIVLTTPIIRCLKQQVPGCEVHYLTKKSFAGVLAGNPYIDQLYTIDKDIDEVLPELHRNEYDLIIDLHHNLRTMMLKHKLKTEASSFDKLNLEKWLMVNLKINKLPKHHIVHRYFETVKELNVKYDGKGLDYFIDSKDEIQTGQLPLSHQNGYVAIVIGAKHQTKIYPATKVSEVIQYLNQPVVLIGGKEDVSRGEEIISLSSNSDNIYNACGKYSLGQSAFLVKNAKLVITNDTGFMHIAAAFNKNIISVWGNTIPEFGMTPFLPEGSSSLNIISEVKNLNCRPCSKIGYDKCPKGHFRCMMENDVISQLDKLAY